MESTPEFALSDVDVLISGLEAQFATGKELKATVVPVSQGGSSCCTHSCPCIEE
ncbi:MAG: hypothetical protein M3Y42_20855 [Actinomycetota bacterium]|nr:hypothetical protein [Actinomycetota bacterium]